MFKIPVLKGYKDSIDLFETLAASVVEKDSNELFKSESIKGIIEYKYQKHLPLLYLLLLIRVIYLCIIYFLVNFNQKHNYFIVIFAIYDCIMLLLQSTPWNKKTFMVWFYFIWGPIADVPLTLCSIAYIIRLYTLPP